LPNHPYTIDILTLFPETVSAVLAESITGRARARGIIDFFAWQIRDFTKNKQRQTDDYPYGGGQGAVMNAQPLADAKRAVQVYRGRKIHTIMLSPAGEPFTQKKARELAATPGGIMLVCGHYEGVDERFIEGCCDECVSLGDFVLTGGEIAACAVADAVFRMIPGVLAEEACFTDESHWDGLLEYPQYTRPAVWEGRAVPEVLLSGNHAVINKWRRGQSELRTKTLRPDLWEKRGGQDT
jgi:tRNA (guanine37-N1)-methyltransferase